eukprot:TRINITY_DN1423_c0_g1_i1.p1 TRINITY_DN1423_c0_g1~~TRINITY_DN1423_c0_g1_i1.p1  ORF type:complete len:411 (+),score=94.66 TRINITY_DN1423_c0_g1_i1:54-1286(+)
MEDLLDQPQQTAYHSLDLLGSSPPAGSGALNVAASPSGDIFAAEQPIAAVEISDAGFANSAIADDIPGSIAASEPAATEPQPQIEQASVAAASEVPAAASKPAQDTRFKAAAPSAKLRDKVDFAALEDIYAKEGQLRQSGTGSMYGLRLGYDARGRPIGGRRGDNTSEEPAPPPVVEPEPEPVKPDAPLVSVTAGRARPARRAAPATAAPATAAPVTATVTATVTAPVIAQQEIFVEEKPPVVIEPAAPAVPVLEDVSLAPEPTLPGTDIEVPKASGGGEPTLRVCVTSPRKMGDGLSAYTRYDVVTQADFSPPFCANHFFVQKRYSEFALLREHLFREQPGATEKLPPFPDKKMLGRFDLLFVESRREQLQTFVQAAADAFPSSPYVLRFLRQDAKPFSDARKSVSFAT